MWVIKKLFSFIFQKYNFELDKAKSQLPNENEFVILGGSTGETHKNWRKIAYQKLAHGTNLITTIFISIHKISK